MDRVSEVMDALAASAHGASVMEVAREIRMSRQGAARLLDSMVASGLAVREDSRRYSLSLRSYYWGARAVERLHPSPFIHQEMVRLAYGAAGEDGRLGERNRAVVYLTLDDPWMVIVDRIDLNHRHAPFIRTHWSSHHSGILFAAFSPTEKVSDLLEREAQAGKTAEEIAGLRADIERARANGYIERLPEEGRTYLAMAPILTRNDYAAAILTFVVEPVAESAASGDLEALLDTTARCSASLGYRASVATL